MRWQSDMAATLERASSLHLMSKRSGGGGQGHQRQRQQQPQSVIGPHPAVHPVHPAEPSEACPRSCLMAADSVQASSRPQSHQLAVAQQKAGSSDTSATGYHSLQQGSQQGDRAVGASIRPTVYQPAVAQVDNVFGLPLPLPASPASGSSSVHHSEAKASPILWPAVRTPSSVHDESAAVQITSSS